MTTSIWNYNLKSICAPPPPAIFRAGYTVNPYNTFRSLLTFYCLTLQKFETALKVESNIEIVFFDAVNSQFYKL